MSTTAEMLRLQRVADRAASRKNDPQRHKCFISYHVDDMPEVEQFIEVFGSEFIARSVGVTVDDDFVNSADEDYIKRRIREKYLTDSTVTIVLLGRRTWTRKFVDWEISSSLRNDTNNKRNGLLVYPLPSLRNTAHLPQRIADNWSANNPENSYAHYYRYPLSPSALRFGIETAFKDRIVKARFVDNSRALQAVNLSCL